MTTTKTAREPDLEHEAARVAAGNRWRRRGAVVLGWIGFLGVWWFVSTFIFGPFRLPPPLEIAEEMWDVVTSGEFVTNMWASILRVFEGFALAVLIGTPLGFLMGRSRYWKAFFHTPVVIAGSIPGITYAVMALVLFGLAPIGPVVSVALIAMPYIAINVAEGVEGVDRDLVNMSQAFHRSETQVFRHVVVPSVLPFIFAGVRLSFAISWKVGQLTEVFGSSKGVGFQIRKNFQEFDIGGVIAWVMLFILFMLFLERFVLVRIERRVFRWRHWERETA